MNDRSPPRVAPDEAESVLLDAVERVLAKESPSSVSMRAIAQEANCSLGLAYNYFSSKDELIGAALDRMASRLAGSAASADDPREALFTLLDAMRSTPAFPLLVTWLVLEGRDVTSVMSGHPVMEQVAAIADERDVDDPVTAAMTMGLLAIGVSTYGEMLNRAVGRESEDPRLRQAAGEMYSRWFPNPPD